MYELSELDICVRYSMHNVNDIFPDTMQLDFSYEFLGGKSVREDVRRWRKAVELHGQGWK